MEPAGAEFANDELEGLLAEWTRAARCKVTWVMDLGAYRRLRRKMADTMPDSEQDESKWVPEPGDRLLGERILVREGGGEPHIEWLEPA